MEKKCEAGRLVTVVCDQNFSRRMVAEESFGEILLRHRCFAGSRAFVFGERQNEFSN